MVDQADKLRALVNDKKETGNKNKINDYCKGIKSVDDKDSKVKIISIISGKGGVGKTNFAVNLAIKLQQMGKKVLIMDADIGMSNVNILLGVETHLDLSDLLEDRAPTEDIIITCPYGVDLISGSADLAYIEGISKKKQLKIMQVISSLSQYDIVIIDNGAGIDKVSLTFMNFSDEIILITTPEPTAITDAYRVLKAMSIFKIKDNAKVVFNQIDNITVGEEAYSKLHKASEYFLDMRLENLGYIYYDSKVIKSVIAQSPVVIKYPSSAVSKNITLIGQNLLEDKNYYTKVSNFAQLARKLFKLVR